MRNIFPLVALIGLASCTMKPDTTRSELGAEFTQDALNKALVDSMTLYPQDKAFRKGDVAAVMFIDRVLKQEAVREIRDLKVLDVTAKEIVIQEYQRTTGNSAEHRLPRRTGDFGDYAGLRQSPRWLTMLPKPFQKAFSFLFDRFFNRISIETSSAVAENIFSAASNDMRKLLQNRVSAMTQPAGTSPQATPAESRFYGLTIQKHKISTLNSGQFPTGKLDSTRVEFNQILIVNGREQRIHHSYEFSTQGPGLTSLWMDFPYVSMESCYSSLIDQDGSSIPYTRCYTTADFRLAQ